VSAAPSRRQIAYAALRERILSLELKPNDAIPETAVAEELGVSRTPVREALAALEREGMVRVLPGKGAFVAPAAADRIGEVYVVREVLEGLAARLATGRVLEAELRPLEAVFQAHLAGDDVDAGRVQTAADALHSLIAEASGNGYLQHLLAEMEHQVRHVREVSINRSKRLLHSCREHLAIIGALEAGDPEAAEATMRDHLCAVRDGLSPLAENGTDGSRYETAER